MARTALVGVLVATTLILAHPSTLKAQAKPTAATSPALPASTAPADTILPEDLEPQKPNNYIIAAGDLLDIRLERPNGPNMSTGRQARVSDLSGNVSVLFLKDPIQAKGLTTSQLEQAIIKTCRDGNLTLNANVSVTVVELRSRSFDIGGAVENPQTYPISILDPDCRLLKAIELAKLAVPNSQISSIRVIRPQPNESCRIIRIPASKVLEADERCNILIRPHDVIHVRRFMPPRSVIHLKVRVGDEILIEDTPSTWDYLEDCLVDLTNRGDTVLEITPDSPELPVGKYLAARKRALDLVSKWGLKSLSLDPVEESK